MESKWSSRKFKSCWYLTGLITSLTIIPYIYHILQGSDLLITGEQYLWFLFGIWSSYFGMNVAEKGKYFQAKPQSKVDNPDEEK